MEPEHKKEKEEELQARERELEIHYPTSNTYTNSLGMEFELITPGEFLMGAAPQDDRAEENEKPQHKVWISKPFYLGKYLVTQQEWENLMGNNPSEFKQAGKRAPVETVSWNDCQEFIKKLNHKESRMYRLPTEAEWEFAARGGGAIRSPFNSFLYTYGDDTSILGEYAWFEKNSKDTTYPVGQKKPNSIGLYDMMGNTWEWCEDWYDNYYYKKSHEEDPKGSDIGENKVLRGGSWYYNDKDCRISNRFNRFPDLKYYNYGFRLVLLP